MSKYERLEMIKDDQLRLTKNTSLRSFTLEFAASISFAIECDSEEEAITICHEELVKLDDFSPYTLGDSRWVLKRITHHFNGDQPNIGESL